MMMPMIMRLMLDDFVNEDIVGVWCVCSLQASVLCCVAVVCLMGTAGALDQLVAARSTVVHVRVFSPPGFLRDKPEVFVHSGSRVQVISNLQANGLQVDRYGNYHENYYQNIKKTLKLLGLCISFGTSSFTKWRVYKDHTVGHKTV